MQFGRSTARVPTPGTITENRCLAPEAWYNSCERIRRFDRRGKDACDAKAIDIGKP
jgi:hypothetical protein